MAKMKKNKDIEKNKEEISDIAKLHNMLMYPNNPVGTDKYFDKLDEIMVRLENKHKSLKREENINDILNIDDEEE